MLMIMLMVLMKVLMLCLMLVLLLLLLLLLLLCVTLCLHALAAAMLAASLHACCSRLHQPNLLLLRLLAQLQGCCHGLPSKGGGRKGKGGWVEGDSREVSPTR